MKKVILSIVMVLSLAILSGCDKKITTLVLDDVHTDTILFKEDGTIQGATVEEFNKTYYDLNELRGFILKEIEKFNKDYGTDAVSIEDLIQKEGYAILLLNYNTVETYSKFNGVKNSQYTMENISEISKNLPDVYVNAKDGAFTSKDVVLKNNDYKVIIINESIDVVVSGTIKYYDNAILVNKNKIQTPTKGSSVIVYKP